MFPDYVGMMMWNTLNKEWVFIEHQFRTDIVGSGWLMGNPKQGYYCASMFSQRKGD